MEKIIDVSDNQGVIDWQQVSKHISFAILRSVRGSGKLDYQFKANVEGCRKYGIGFDVYKYSYALTEDASIREAQQVVAALQSVGCCPEVTVWWDIPSTYTVTKTGISTCWMCRSWTAGSGLQGTRITA